MSRAARPPLGPFVPRARLRVVAAALACGGLGLCSPAAAFDFSGDKALVARFRDGGQLQLGHLLFTPMPTPAPGHEPQRATFKLVLNTTALTDHFLSMREFKCLPGGTEITCVVPYPYAHPGTAAPGQLAWLEHNLLFLFKQPADFGAKLWNGVIFKFTETPTALVGRPQAVDLNAISAPPERLDEPPYTDAERTDFPAGARWVTELRIE
jgi:hypothetical protein